MHSVTIQKQVGDKKINITVTGATPAETLKELGKWSFPGVSQCGICKKNILDIQHRVTKEENHDYIFVRCLSCGAELTFGKKKTGDVIYLRTNDSGHWDWKQLEKGEK